MSPGEPPRPPPVLEFTLDLPAEPETVCRLLTDPAAIATWFAPQVEGSGMPGSELVLGWGPDIRWKTRVAPAEPGRLVRWQDELDAYRELPSWLRTMADAVFGPQVG